MKQEGGTVVNKILYPLPPPRPHPQQQGFNPPPPSAAAASQSVRPHTKLQNTSPDAICKVDQQCPSWPRSLLNNMAPPWELQKDSTSGCQIAEISLAKGQREQRE